MNRKKRGLAQEEKGARYKKKTRRIKRERYVIMDEKFTEEIPRPMVEMSEDKNS